MHQIEAWNRAVRLRSIVLHKAKGTNELLFQGSLFWEYAENLLILCGGSTPIQFANAELSRALSALPKETAARRFYLYLKLHHEDNQNDEHLQNAEELFATFPDEVKSADGTRRS